jgi:lipopolysaccharide export system permease protein
VSPRRRALYGLTVYQLTPDFRPWRTIEAESANWDGGRWQLLGVRTREFGADGVREVPRAPEGFVLPESLDDFRAVSVEPEELSYGTLRRQIEDLQRKGVDTSESWVDLHLKLALPAASLMMILIAAPMAAAGTRVGSIAGSMAVGFVIGFGYFVVVAFARALGQTGMLPPAIAAWAGNVVFALIGGYYLLGAD